MLRQTRRAFVEKLAFRTSVGDRVATVITDLGVLARPPGGDGELTLVQLHPGSTVERAREATGWELKVADGLVESSPPTREELAVLRELEATKGLMP
jgi:glutaconate CoA-transferase subunit B